jgi:hypothetical protein
MKPRHAAAPALVGWYLMTPPLDSGQVLSDAPISQQRHPASTACARFPKAARRL